MLDRLLPRQADNAYRGHRLALWLLGALVVFKCGIGFGTLFNGRAAAIGADGIPLDSFGAAGAQAFVALFAAWGLAQVVLNLIAALALVRYRALVPLMFALLLLEHLGRRLVFRILPLPRSGTPPGFWINLALVALMIVGLALSLWNRSDAREVA